MLIDKLTRTQPIPGPEGVHGIDRIFALLLTVPRREHASYFKKRRMRRRRKEKKEGE
jgi:hypothetical protein